MKFAWLLLLPIILSRCLVLRSPKASYYHSSEINTGRSVVHWKRSIILRQFFNFDYNCCLGNHRLTKWIILLINASVIHFYKSKDKQFPNWFKRHVQHKFYYLVACQVDTEGKFSIWHFLREIIARDTRTR